ncbi:CBS domain-containing protein [Streptomyces nigra]|jgi:CBS domain-containing protein|uniref:CBS domain-containing protein n=1 Tax=Streptomyces TaxID=1883 RepID=UPI00099EB9E4|nr:MULTISPECIES: CBS domain-containing protein [unclassified Streptomyces]MCX3288904.1 CBS domain-containing protein [Streptomyces sp. NEAU-H22]
MARIVGEVMTSEVVEARRETSFKDLARLLDRHRISGLPVVDHDDKVVGVVSETDLIRRQAAQATRGRVRRFRKAALRRSTRHATTAARTTTAEELMSTPAITVHPEQRVADAARVMERHHVDRLPVVDEEDRLIGIVTRRDLLRVFLRTDEEIRREVTDDVLTRALCLPPHTVVASVRDGMVTLRGQVEQRGDIPLAIQLTWRVDGVVGVVNNLTFRGDDTRPRASAPGHGSREGHPAPEAGAGQTQTGNRADLRGAVVPEGR